MNTQRVEGHTPKDCPFCGSVAKEQVDYGEEPQVYIYCSNDSCWLYDGGATWEQWNNRSPSIERLEKVNEALVRALWTMVEGFDAEDQATIPQVKAAVEALRLAKEPA